jgi:hypothetical protein
MLKSVILLIANTTEEWTIMAATLSKITAASIRDLNRMLLQRVAEMLYLSNRGLMKVLGQAHMKPITQVSLIITPFEE